MSTIADVPTDEITSPRAVENLDLKIEGVDTDEFKNLWLLLEKNLTYLDTDSLKKIQRAFDFARAAHAHQKRSSGEHYIHHPTAVAILCTQWRLDTDAICAALLHDTVEDSDNISAKDITDAFGEKVAELVDGLTKISHLPQKTIKYLQAESFRKMLFAMASDIRVILIKLCDRLHNSSTLMALPIERRNRIAHETRTIYVPIAKRLGLENIAQSLEQNCFEALNPYRFQVIAKAVESSKGRRFELVQGVILNVTSALQKVGIKAELMGREKNIVSIYNKMKEKNIGFTEVYDMYGFRVLVEKKLDCYVALGVLHGLYPPLPLSFKDFVAIPKANGYQSLHTVVSGPAALPLEFQLRTFEMDKIAQYGVAAHWSYKLGGENKSPSGMKWLQSLIEIQKTSVDSEEFFEHIKLDLEAENVYVLTPKSKIIELVRGATVLDFAYAVHSDVGNNAIDAKVNGERVPLSKELNNGDTVQIETQADSRPTPEWLAFVKTGRARTAIRHSLKINHNYDAELLGERLLKRACYIEGINLENISESIMQKLISWTGNKSREEVMLDIGLGKRAARILAKRLASELKPTETFLMRSAHLLRKQVARVIREPIELNGHEGMPVQYAACCQPIPGDVVVGYLGKGEGVIVHDTHCAGLGKLRRQGDDHFVSLHWSNSMQKYFQTNIQITLENNRGVLAEIATLISRHNADIVKIDMDESLVQKTLTVRFHLLVANVTMVSRMLRALKRVKYVIRAERLRPGYKSLN